MEGEEDNGSGRHTPEKGKWGPETWPQETMKGKQRGSQGPKAETIGRAAF